MNCQKTEWDQARFSSLVNSLMDKGFDFGSTLLFTGYSVDCRIHKLFNVLSVLTRGKVPVDTYLCLGEVLCTVCFEQSTVYISQCTVYSTQ